MLYDNNTNRSSAPEDEKTQILRKYDITGVFAQHLNKLTSFKMVLICDDSTSMREILNKGQTKWDELRESVNIVLDIANAYKVEADVLFLNRPGCRCVKNMGQLQQQFSTEPYGNTPLTECFNAAIRNNNQELNERKLLIIIFTDGCPTSARLNQKEAIKEFKRALQNRNPMSKIFVSIVACTDDEYSLKYLNRWDVEIENLDVVDDYESEKREIYEAKRTKEAFTFGDYIAKILLGSFVKEIDDLDEPVCCTIV